VLTTAACGHLLHYGSRKLGYPQEPRPAKDTPDNTLSVRYRRQAVTRAKPGGAANRIDLARLLF